MAPEVFMDISGFYALLVKSDDCHVAATRFLRRAERERGRFVTTDYVLDETATLLKARGHGHVLKRLFSAVFSSSACRVEWTDSDRFIKTTGHLLKHLDQGWSFTDCLSFVVMKALNLREALTKDAHFEQAGFAALLREAP